MLDPHRARPRSAPFPSLKAPASLSLSVVTPAYNEEKRLPVMLRETIDYLQDRAKKQQCAAAGPRRLRSRR